MSGTFAHHLRTRLLGLLLVVLVVAFLVFTISAYNGVFSTDVPVTLKADHVGNELQQESDVKVRGMLVGSVKEVNSTGDGAVLQLAMDPSKIGMIPANVTARLLPKSLFGERYVDLEIPENPSAQHLASGAVIGEDRSSSALELEKVLDDLLPVLQAVQPQKLSSTLTAISTALDGRGKQLGQTLDQLGSYTKQLNPHVSTLEHDLQALVGVTDTYSKAAPDLISALNDLTVTSKTVFEQKANLDALFSTLTTASNNLTNFLQANESNLIQVAAASRPTLDVLAKYAPEYPCFLKGMAAEVPLINKAFGEGTNEHGLHATIEVTVNRGKYVPGEEPKYDDKRGPRCYNFAKQPNPFPQYPPDGPIEDGSTHPPAARSSQDGLLPPANGASAGTHSAQTSSFTASGGSDGLGIVNSPAEQSFVNTLVAPSMGGDPAAVPSWTSYLVGPLFRGAEVNFQ